jgi:hypothetical protein
VLSSLELWVRTPAEAASSTPADEYQVRGLRCLGPVSSRFDFGQVAISGSTQIEDGLCGTVVVTPGVGLSAEDVDVGVDRVLDILSFATGRRLRASVHPPRASHQDIPRNPGVRRHLSLVGRWP